MPKKKNETDTPDWERLFSGISEGDWETLSGGVVSVTNVTEDDIHLEVSCYFTAADLEELSAFCLKAAAVLKSNAEQS